ncbi:hypothetical protein WA026_001101 [Henosepilachna vigintioctopunctata]|uniref:Uncharacterized protein n=1 Tax=Henosepilachna vigintioctopunctata TaxID=420089 RepID=A0AAW1V2J8_9CUCU
MNPIGSRIGNLILTSLIENKNLKSLNLEACNIKVDKNIGQLLQTSTLEELYMSNNLIGDEIGNIILNSLYSNGSLKKFDLRMCCIHSDIQQKISERVKEIKLKQFHISHTCEKQIKLNFDQSFLLYFDSIQLNENLVPKDETLPLNIE